MKKTTMADVARLAQVSTATVSHVINGSRFVSEDIARRVSRAISALSYSPNQMARNLKTGRSNAILFIVPDIANDFFSVAIEKVEDVLAEKGYRLIIANTKESPKRELMHLRSINNGMVDGILLASTLSNREELQSILPSGIPTVLVDRTFPGCTMDTVCILNHDAMFCAVVALAEAGHKRIGYISGLPRLSSTQERLNAYKDAMYHCGLAVEPGFVQIGDSRHASSPHCYEMLVKKSCTAIIISNGIMANDVMFYCYGQNAIATRDISIVGYIESELYPQANHYFAAIRQPSNELGEKAGLQILKRIQDPDNLPESIRIPAQLLTFKTGKTF